LLIHLDSELFVVIFRLFVVEPFKSYNIFAIHEKRVSI